MKQLDMKGMIWYCFLILCFLKEFAWNCTLRSKKKNNDKKKWYELLLVIVFYSNTERKFLLFP